ncbi:hypothetical protein DVG79_15835 [Exiguobacterium sp. RIT594]|nr:hypothetical protein DVG79_15835 [Exiguobacterium sp. RIT594]
MRPSGEQVTGSKNLGCQFLAHHPKKIGYGTLSAHLLDWQCVYSYAFSSRGLISFFFFELIIM